MRKLLTTLSLIAVIFSQFMVATPVLACTVTDSSATNDNVNWGRVTGAYATYGYTVDAFKFVAGCTGTIASVQVTQFIATGSPGDQMKLILNGDNSGVPNDSNLGSSGNQTVTHSDPTEEIDTINWSSGGSVTSGTTYWIVTNRGSGDNSNYYTLRAHNLGGANNLATAGASWATITEEAPYVITITAAAAATSQTIPAIVFGW